MQRIEWPLPAWLGRVTAEERRAAHVRYYLNLAATYATEAGTAPALSEALGLNPTAINVAKARGKVSPEMAVKIELLLGRECFPRELFNDIFVIEQ